MIRILCVDDDTLILECLKEEILRSEINDVEVETATSYDEAIEIIQYYMSLKLSFNFIISDYIMPKVKGDKVLIYADKCFPNSTKILLSGQIENEKITYLKKNIRNILMFQKPWRPNFINSILKGEKYE